MRIEKAYCHRARLSRAAVAASGAELMELTFALPAIANIERP